MTKISAIANQVTNLNNAASRFVLYDADGAQTAYINPDDLFGATNPIAFQVIAGSNGIKVENGQLLVEGSAATGTTANSAVDDFVIDGTGNRGATFLAGASSIAGLRMGDTDATDRGGLDYDNSSDELLLRAAGTNFMKVVNGGIQIWDGSAWGETISRFDHDISWTPTLIGTTSGSAAGYSTQIGRYSRIADWVFYSGRVIMTGVGTITGNVRVGGLPFTSAASLNASCSVGYVQYNDYGADLYGEVINSSSEIRLMRNRNDSSLAASSIGTSDIGGTFGLQVDGVYRAA